MNAWTRLRGRGFTIVELVVVITIIVLLLAIAVPAFRTMIRSSEEALAESLLRAAIRSGKDAAVRVGAPGRDGGVAFFFESGGRLTIVPVVQVGSFEDGTNPKPPTGPVRRDVFVPVPEFSPVRLPEGWMVRGFVPAMAAPIRSGRDRWMEDTNNDQRYGSERAWIFPETDFYNQRTRERIDVGGSLRNSFMIRFEGGTGILKADPWATGVVVSPRPSVLARDVAPFDRPEFRVDATDDLARTVRAILGSTATIRERLIGRNSNDAVVVRPVSIVALYNEVQMIAGLNSAPNAFARLEFERNGTGTIYRNLPLDVPTYVNNAFQGRMITNWIEGDTNQGGFSDPTDTPLSKIFAVDRFSGSLNAVTLQREAN